MGFVFCIPLRLGKRKVEREGGRALGVLFFHECVLSVICFVLFTVITPVPYSYHKIEAQLYCHIICNPQIVMSP